jgi:hypothetical protein
MFWPCRTVKVTTSRAFSLQDGEAGNLTAQSLRHPLPGDDKGGPRGVIRNRHSNSQNHPGGELGYTLSSS